MADYPEVVSVLWQQLVVLKLGLHFRIVCHGLELVMTLELLNVALCEP